MTCSEWELMVAVRSDLVEFCCYAFWIMKAKDLEQFLFKEIPISKALGIRVANLDQAQAEIAAPLAANANHLGTAFGGSLQAVTVLSCYSWLFNALENHKPEVHVVLKENKMKFLHPVAQNFSAICKAPEAKNFARFLKMMAQKHRAQITLHASITINEKPACLYEGKFVIIPK